MEEELKKYGLRIHWRTNEGHNSDDPDDYEPIDFSIDDGTDNVAWVWGSEPFNDVQIECNHPEECIEWDDDETCGECKLCGAQCTWGWVDEIVEEGRDEDGAYYARTGKERKIGEWYTGNMYKGLIGKYLKELQKRW